MLRFLRADLRRLTKGPALSLFLLGMLLVAAAMMVMQATGMDYTVPLSRVVFLPLSFYGVAAAAFVSVFAGTDFSDGVIRNKLIAARRRRDVALSLIATCCAACMVVYALISLLTLGIGTAFFENDVAPATFAAFFLLGLGMSASVACLFCAIALLCGDRVRAILWCMGLAFAMLFLCLHTHQVMVHAEVATGLRRTVYGMLHDLNPCGQAAQLSAWHVWNPLRAALCDLVWIAGFPALSCLWFDRKDIQ